MGWLLADPNGNACAVDVPDADALLSVLAVWGFRLSDLLFTHSHHDHIDRVPKVLHETGCRAWGAPDAGLPVSVQPLQDGDRIRVGEWGIQVMETSGHSPLDLTYVLPEQSLCFCGDTVFDGGCGRMFAGPASVYWASICRIREMPEPMQLCVGHDYAEENYRFACSVLPHNPQLLSKAREASWCAPSFPLPIRVGEQKQHNLFFRADDPGVAASLGLTGLPPETVFEELRERKNRF